MDWYLGFAIWISPFAFTLSTIQLLAYFSFALSLKRTHFRHLVHNMSYNRRRHETLGRLGIEQLPTLRYHHTRDEPRRHFDFDLPVRTMPVSVTLFDASLTVHG